MLLSINEQDPRPVYVQIVSQIKDQIQRGSLKPGDELPSVRELSASLGINMHTVRRAERLQELITEAFLLGLSPDDFRNLVNSQIDRLKEQAR